MFGALIIVTIGVGSALAYATRSYRLRADLFEACAGVCLIAGLGLLGASLPHLA